MKVDEAVTTLRGWAKQKIKEGHEPPWSWYQYMKLIETLDAIAAARLAGTTETESSPLRERRPGASLQLVDQTYQPNTVRSHPAEPPVRLPM